MTRVELCWGAAGARRCRAEVTVVVDVLSFTTTLSVAVDRGIEVLPYAWRDETAAVFAADSDATLAVGRRDAGPGEVSLSPASVLRSGRVRRLVLPSPNGSAICRELADRGAVVLGGCLRNATAVAGWIGDRAPGSVAVVAAGEQWPDGSLRPALEDLLGAGAVLEAMPADVVLDGDALAARAAFREARPSLLERLVAAPSGKELLTMGFADDIAVAAELDASTAVPLLEGGCFRAA